MGIITSLYRVKNTDFGAYERDGRLHDLLDILLGYQASELPMDYQWITLDKAWYEFEQVFNALLPAKQRGILDSGFYRIEYKDMDVCYWTVPKKLGLLKACALVAGQAEFLSTSQLEPFYLVLKERMERRFAQDPTWRTERGDPFDAAYLDYVFHHLCHALRFLTTAWENEEKSIIIRVSS